jgi:hypothetical protein
VSDDDLFDSTQETKAPERRGVDPLALIMGVVVLFASAYVLTDGAVWLPGSDPRWLVAGGALFVGLVLLAVSLRRRRT